MQHNRTCPNCGAQIEEGQQSVSGQDDRPQVEHCAVILGPPLVEHRSRDYLGRPVGIVGVGDVGIPMSDD